MNINVKKIFEVRFKIRKETIIALILSIASIVVSVLMNVFNTYAGKLILSDILQISVFGVIIPFMVLSKNRDFFNAGLRFDKPLKYILISIVLGGFTAIGFIKQAPGGISTVLRIENLFPALYVMTACTMQALSPFSSSFSS